MDLSKLTPEEQAQVAQLQAELGGAPTEQPKVEGPDLSALSPEEQATAAQLQAELAPVSSVTNVQELEDASVAAENVTTDEGEFGPLQTAADFALSLGNRIPGAKQASAAVGSLLFDEPFEQSLAQNESIANTAKERSPNASVAGAIVADGTALLAGGGAAVAGVKALGFTGKLAAVASAASVDFGLSFAQEVTDANGLDDDSTLDSATKAAKDAVFGLASGGALTAIGKTASPIAKRILALNGFKNLDSVKDQLSIRLVNTAQTKDRFLKTLKKSGLGDDAVINQPAKADKIIRETAPNKIGAQLDAAYTKIDTTKLKVDTTGLYQEVVNTTEEFASDLASGKLSPSAEKVKQKLLDKLGVFQPTGKEGQTVFVPNDNFSVKDLWEARRNIDTHFPAGKQKASRDALLRTLENTRKSALNKAINSGDEVLSKAAKEVEELSVDYGNLKFLEGQIGKEGSSILGDQGKNLFSRFARNINGATVSSGTVAGAIGFSVGGLPGAAIGVGSVVGVNTLINAPKFLRSAQKFSSAADNAILNHADKVSATVSTLVDLAQGDKQSPAAAALVAKINSDFSSKELTDDDVAELTDLAESTVSLITSPLKRTANAALNRGKDILRIAKKVNPAIANQMVDMIRKGEDLGPLMEQIAKSPETRELIEPGQGWEGKTYDPELKGQITNQLKAARGIPTQVRKQAIKQLEADGTIPDVEALPKREPIKHNPRDKKKERF